MSASTSVELPGFSMSPSRANRSGLVQLAIAGELDGRLWALGGVVRGGVGGWWGPSDKSRCRSCC